MRRALVVLVTATALAAPATAVHASEPEVTGYALPDLPHRVLERNAPGLTTLTVVGASITADGRRAVRPPADSVRLGRKARREGLRTELLVSNYSDRIGDFDTRAAGRLLRSPANVRRVARQLASYVEAGG